MHGRDEKRASGKEGQELSGFEVTSRSAILPEEEGEEKSRGNIVKWEWKEEGIAAILAVQVWIKRDQVRSIGGSMKRPIAVFSVSAESDEPLRGALNSSLTFHGCVLGMAFPPPSFCFHCSIGFRIRSLVEGKVNKLKLIKRMMFGRAEFPLLRQHVLHAL
jgi:hypothetical protein